MDILLGVFIFILLCIYWLGTTDIKGSTSTKRKSKTYNDIQEERRKRKELRGEIDRALRNK